MNQRIIEITNRIIERSKVTRTEYLADMKAANEDGVARKNLHCGNLAHAFAGCSSHEKGELAENETPNLGIITAYNDMLSAHKTFEHFPEKIRAFAIGIRSSILPIASLSLYFNSSIFLPFLLSF
jgi:phosphogluconate dehydratase